jgi:predicted DNA-binding transcriptional regulator AlpA
MLQAETSHSLLDGYYTETEMAARLGKSTRTLYDWRKQGIGPPPTPVGRNYFYRKSSAERWLEELERA